jgi:hypothetical protein
MLGHVLGAVALLAVVIAGGTVWLLVRDERGLRRSERAAALRRLATASVALVLVTVIFWRPWYWDLAIAVLAAAAYLGIRAMLRVLERRASPATGGAIAAALASVVIGSVLVTMGGTAAVLDGAAVVGGTSVPVPHQGRVLTHAVLYQVFWGPAWDGPGTAAALAQAVAFEHALPTSRWAAAVVDAGFGIRSLRAGGCWIDPGPPRPSGPASSMLSGPFPDELYRVFEGHPRLVPCPGLPPSAVPGTLPPDALVAVWLDPAVAYGLGGVSAHGSVPWPGRPDGLATAGLTGGFASWGSPACTHSPACRSVPPFASPTDALSHEMVETVTNPYGRGWFADVPLRYSARYFLSHGPTSLLGTAPDFPGEVADLCEPSQPAPSNRAGPGAGGTRPVALAPFYRPGTGCVS